MKRLIGAVLVLSLVLPVAPVLAGDTFHALSRLAATAQASLPPMSDAQLAAIEGGQMTQGNTATVTVTQSNVFTGSAASVVQQNTANVVITQQNTAGVL